MLDPEGLGEARPERWPLASSQTVVRTSVETPYVGVKQARGGVPRGSRPQGRGRLIHEQAAPPPDEAAAWRAGSPRSPSNRHRLAQKAPAEPSAQLPRSTSRRSTSATPRPGDGAASMHRCEMRKAIAGRGHQPALARRASTGPRPDGVLMDDPAGRQATVGVQPGRIGRRGHRRTPPRPAGWRARDRPADSPANPRARCRSASVSCRISRAEVIDSRTRISGWAARNRPGCGASQRVAKVALQATWTVGVRAGAGHGLIGLRQGPRTPGRPAAGQLGPGRRRTQTRSDLLEERDTGVFLQRRICLLTAPWVRPRA